MPLDFDAVRQTLGAAVMRICPDWLREQREDLVQTAMLRIVEQTQGVRERKLNATYIWRTAYTVTVDEIRRARWKMEAPLDDNAAAGASASARDPESEVALLQMGEGVRECLQGLVPLRRHAVVLHFLGYAPRETAALLGAPAKRVYNLVQRGLEDLRSCLRAKGWSP